MGDPFRDHLVDVIEACLGHHLVEPDRIHSDDIKSICGRLRAYRNELEEIQEITEGIDIGALMDAIEKIKDLQEKHESRLEAT